MCPISCLNKFIKFAIQIDAFQFIQVTVRTQSQIIERIRTHLSVFEYASYLLNPSLKPLFHTLLNNFTSSLRVAWSFKERLGLPIVQFFINNIARRKESRVARARGKCPMEAHHQEAQTQARYDTNIFNSMEEQS